jgi:hypothetical protein
VLDYIVEDMEQDKASTTSFTRQIADALERFTKAH